jgi:CO/xanthine dehydrogenase FAD-binding subunit
MQDFEYIATQSIAETVDVLSRMDGGARILAGGTDLLVQLREGRRKASLVVDIKRIPELSEISFDPMDGLSIGAGAPCYRILEVIRPLERFAGLAAAVELIGGTQIQGRASLGGNLCNASPAADSIPALIVHQAVCVIHGPSGQRRMPVEEFCLAPGQTALQRGEFLVSLILPPPPPGFGAHYLRFIPRHEMDIAVAGAAAALVLEDDRSTICAARLALSAVAPTPLFVPAAGQYMLGRPATADTFREAAQIARSAARPIDDMRGTIQQRTHLTGVLARRALETAAARAGKRD